MVTPPPIHRTGSGLRTCSNKRNTYSFGFHEPTSQQSQQSQRRCFFVESVLFPERSQLWRWCFSSSQIVFIFNPLNFREFYAKRVCRFQGEMSPITQRRILFPPGKLIGGPVQPKISCLLPWHFNGKTSGVLADQSCPPNS